MRHRVSPGYVALALACSLALPGCPPPARPPEPPPGSGTRVSTVGNAVAGAPSWQGRVVCVLWFDVQHMSAGVGEKFHGLVERPDGRKVTWDCVTPDGRTGTVGIDGTGYDLANGTLFLVSVHGPEPRVRQLAYDVSGLNSEGDDFRRLAADHPEVAAFVANAPKGE